MRWEKERFKVIHRVELTMRRWEMTRPGQTLLVAVSGGRDSLVLLDVMVQLAPRAEIALRVLHVDHGLRPESTADAAFVEGVAQHYGLPCSVLKVEISREGKGKPLSPEEAAREARYEAFERELSDTGADCLATGHTADDRVETMLIRLISGAGPSALASIAPVRYPYVRPAIEVWRSEVDAHVPFLPFVPREDPSNLDLSIPRNRIRHELLPLLERQYNPSIRKALLREADMLASSQELVTPLIEEAMADVSSLEGDIEIDIQALGSRPLAIKRQVIVDVLTGLGIEPDFDMVEDIRLKVLEAKGNPRLVLSAGVTARKVYGSMIIGSRPSPVRLQGRGATEEWIIPGEGNYLLRYLSLRLRISSRPYGGEDPKGSSSGPAVAWLDASCLSFPLKVRRIRPGDRFHPLGSQGTKKVQDFLVDLKLPREDRRNVIVLESGGKIVWLLGLRMDDRFKVNEDTSRMAVIEFERV